MRLSSRSFRRWLMGAACVVGLYAVLGFLVAPGLVRTQIERRTGAALARPVSVEKVRINPFALSITVEGLRVGDHDGSELASWDSAYVNFEAIQSLVRWQWHLGEVLLAGPRMRLAVDPDGRLNVADLIETPARPEEGAGALAGEGSGMPALGIGRLRVQEWVVAFSDASRRRVFETRAGPMSFELSGFATRPGTESPYHFVGVTDSDERFEWSGTLSADPVGSSGRVTIEGVVLSKHMPLIEHLLEAEMPSGRISFATNYHISLADEPTVRLSDARMVVSELEVRHPGATDAAVKLSSLEVVMPDADLVGLTAHISRVSLSELAVQVVRRADGSIDLLDWLGAPEAGGLQTPGEGAGDAGPRPEIVVDEMTLTGASLAVRDETTAQPAQLQIDSITLRATNVCSDLGRQMGVDLSLRWAGRGIVSAVGVVRPQPLAARIEIKGDAIDLRPLNPYLESMAQTRLESGDGRLVGRIEATQAEGGSLALRWQGDAAIDAFAAVNLADGQPWCGWTSLELTGTRFMLDPLEVSVDEVRWREPAIRVSIDEKGAMNLASIARPGQASTPPAEADARAPEETGPQLKATVNAVQIEGGRATFVDGSFKPGYRAEVTGFGGTIKGLSSDNLARADVDLRARLDGVSSLEVRGAINPLAQDLFSDVTVVVDNIELSRFTPYSGRFLGRAIDKGKLRLDLTYRVSANTLDGANHAVFDQFFLGGEVESAEAIRLPIGLALGLLRDRDGRIDLDLPVSGRLDDPDFKYGRIVWQAVRNLVLKAATSPFSMLGGMFGGEKAGDLSFVAFASGSAEVSEAERGKLEVLAKAMFERPGMRLEIGATPCPEGDRPGLVERRYRSLLLAEKRALATGETGMEAEVASEAISAEEEELLVGRIVARLFPDDAARAPGAEAADAADAVPDTVAEKPARPGVVSRVWHRMIGREEAPAERREPGAPAPTEGAPQGPAEPTFDEMRAQVLGSIEIADADYAALAEERVRVVQAQILADGRVEAQRVFLVARPQGGDAGAPAASEGGRVVFGLDGS